MNINILFSVLQEVKRYIVTFLKFIIYPLTMIALFDKFAFDIQILYVWHLALWTDCRHYAFPFFSYRA